MLEDIDTYKIEALLKAGGVEVKTRLRAQSIPHRGNNRCYVVIAGEQQYFLKVYFRGEGDSRDRCKTEVAFTALLSKHRELNTYPNLIAANIQQGMALFEYLQGNSFNSGGIGAAEVTSAMDFVKAVNELRKDEDAKQLSLASEPCLSWKEHFGLVRSRVSRLLEVAVSDATCRTMHQFVKETLSPKLSKIGDRISSEINDPNYQLDRNMQCISPSDFGFHNAVRTSRGICFLDFEYAGWDDPARMVCDFFCQPRIPVSEEHLERVITEVGKWTIGVGELAKRVSLMLPLYRLKWCCIVLNEFLPVSAARRNFSSGGSTQEDTFAENSRKIAQLLKAKELAVKI